MGTRREEEDDGQEWEGIRQGCGWISSKDIIYTHIRTCRKEPIIMHNEYVLINTFSEAAD